MLRDTLVVTDLDGTLLQPDGRVSAASRDLLATVLPALADRGSALTIATARSEATARPVLDGLGLSAPLIVSSGAFTVPWRGGRPLRSALLGPAAVDAVLATSAERGLEPLVLWTDGADERVDRTAVSPAPGPRTFLDEHPDDPRLRAVPDWSGLDRRRVHLVSVRGPEGDIDVLERDLTGLAAHLARASLGGGLETLDVTGARATKGLAARALQRRLGLTRLVAFGDGGNDLPLFAVADESWAVADAPPAVRDAATGVVGASTEDGVARHLAALLG